ncbi:hypothetical protein [Deinococcus sp. QL22]|uniref:hypothetical protein n=1 Tax=Deinococcus sp. QL22 TaxID=2939437 RepID=UPI0020177951|nr:hypothetical protein [Deinococcus sp. QL22]UQN05127.1 hypothetical protein M1R55_09460 [Deinococcus sp. QL22]
MTIHTADPVQHLQRSFARLGMRVLTAPTHMPRWGRRASTFDIDVARDARGEHFLIRLPEEAAPELLTLDVRPELRQLLLLARVGERKDKFLCGFDERHLFTAAVPGQSVRDVLGAMHALKPTPIQISEARLRVRGKDRLRRRNAAFVRQGEWFFAPMPDLIVPAQRVRRNEPLTRGAGSKPHICAEAARLGGEPVMACDKHRNGISMQRYTQLLQSNPKARNWNWQSFQRNPELYVRGDVRHKDHATLHLPSWHRVLMNTENESAGREFVAFLD